MPKSTQTRRSSSRQRATTKPLRTIAQRKARPDRAEIRAPRRAQRPDGGRPNLFPGRTGGR